MKLIVWSILSFMLMLYAMPAPAQQASAAAGRPNIIFILTDDQRWDAAGYAGNRIILTPEMDKLAAEGTAFVNAFVTTPICAASRASFLTGLYERTHRFTFGVDRIVDEHMNLSYPKLMKESGYYTGFYGKLGVKFDERDDLFDQFEFYDRNTKFKDRRGYYYKVLNHDTVHLTPYTGERARQFLASAPKDKPFCLSISFSAPHAHDPAPLQYFWEPDVDHLYADVTIPAPEIADDKYFLALPEVVREGFNRTRWGWRYDNPEKYQHSVKGYYRMISGIDREIGKIRQALKDQGLDQNTVIVIMGDNGYFLGERQLAGKWLLYENSIRVPLIIYDPRGQGGARIDQPTLNIDVPATMLDYAQIALPPNWQGKSLRPLVKGETLAFRRDTILFEHLWETPNIPPSEGVRTEDWKYLRYINDQFLEELYNLKKDPKEIRNLAGDRKYRKVLVSLRSKCDELVGRYQDTSMAVPQGLKSTVTRDEGAGVRVKYDWELSDGVSGTNGYQILVSSSRKLIDRNIGDVWDSKPVTEKRQSADHGAGALGEGTYFWKVRVWDADNRLTEYTKPEKFEIKE